MDDNAHNKRQATRIFKKSTPNGKVTVYLGKRDFIDHLSHVDPVEGVVFVDPEYVKGRKVFISLVGAFKDCRHELENLGLEVCENIFSKTIQVYSSNNLATGVRKSNDIGLSESPTPLQARLIRKLGHNAHPFYFELPAYSPASVTILLSNQESLKPNKVRQNNWTSRVDYELKTYVAESEGCQIQKRSSVKMTIRKLTYAPNKPGNQPTADITKEFLMSPGNLKVEASLDKEKYFHGEELGINLLVDNNSNKTVRRVKISVRQSTQLQVQNLPVYSCTVAEMISEEDFPIQPSRTGWCKEYKLRPLLSNHKDKFGISMDGDLKHEDTNLASSTIPNPNASNKKITGIKVSYKVRIKLHVGLIAKPIILELPFILTHPHPPPAIQPQDSNSDIEEVEEAANQPDLTSSNNDLTLIQSNNPFLSDIIIEKSQADHQRTFSALPPQWQPLVSPRPKVVPLQPIQSFPFVKASDESQLVVARDKSNFKNNGKFEDLNLIYFPNGKQNGDKAKEMNPFEIPKPLSDTKPQNVEDPFFDEVAWNRIISMN